MALSALGPVTKLRDFIQAINYENPPRAHSTLEKPVEEKGLCAGDFLFRWGIRSRNFVTGSLNTARSKGLTRLQTGYTGVTFVTSLPREGNGMDA